MEIISQLWAQSDTVRSWRNNHTTWITFVVNSVDCERLASEYPELVFISEDEQIADILISQFNVCDLESSNRVAQQIPSMKTYLEKSAFSTSSINAYWILLASMAKYSRTLLKLMDGSLNRLLDLNFAN